MVRLHSCGEIVTSVRTALQRRREQSEFVASGIASLNAARQTNDYVALVVVIDDLQRKLDAAKATLAKRHTALRPDLF